MATIIKLFKSEAVDDMSNRKRVIRDSLVEFLATAVFVWAGTMSAVSTGEKLPTPTGEDVARVLPIAMAFGISVSTSASVIPSFEKGNMTKKIPSPSVRWQRLSCPSGFKSHLTIIATYRTRLWL